MKITKEHLMKIIKEELDNAGDDQMLDNLRSTTIDKLVGILNELTDKADVMGVNAVDISGAIQDCIQKLQEAPMTSVYAKPENI